MEVLKGVEEVVEVVAKLARNLRLAPRNSLQLIDHVTSMLLEFKNQR